MELLPDPLKDRMVPTLPCPPNKCLPENLIYPYKGMTSFIFLEIYKELTKE